MQNDSSGKIGALVERLTPLVFTQKINGSNPLRPTKKLYLDSVDYGYFAAYTTDSAWDLDISVFDLLFQIKALSSIG
jgi:hypothetical protein